jgi:signal transduction histidine kinase
VTIRILELDSVVKLSVHNFGKPIPSDELENLFNPFVRSKTVDLSKKKGWGLGLTLVRGVTEAHCGQIDVESNRDEGTTFTVTLPKDPRQKRAA